MLEILKILVEAALKLLNPEAVEKFRREGKQREIGTKLFGLYAGLIDLFPTADYLIKTLKRMLEIKDCVLDGKYMSRQYARRLLEIATRQSEILKRLERPLTELRGPLIVIDAEAANLIQAITFAKANLLRMLIDLLASGYLPMEVSDLIPKEPFGKQLENGLDLETRIAKGALPPMESWSQEELVRAAKYVEEAEQQLLQLREACQKLRTGLESNFSVKEILPELGTKLFAPFFE